MFLINAYFGDYLFINGDTITIIDNSIQKSCIINTKINKEFFINDKINKEFFISNKIEKEFEIKIDLNSLHKDTKL